MLSTTSINVSHRYDPRRRFAGERPALPVAPGVGTITVLATDTPTVTDDPAASESASEPAPDDDRRDRDVETDGGADDQASLEDRTRALADHLEATAELPIERRTNRWLGEAEAVARDAATSDLDPEIARERVEKVRGLLSEADEPDHDRAREHLATARRLCADILDE
ncbi:hypothetical protein [Natrinema salifodinae]|uniref:DUF8152 domain-containing protein n=1 Tax=Natrinema salifodinae TaxID=1202768 RepID=A0A1I0MGE7_9EURY|nr:hypothetical protein SAMN05216285_0880 [Natrinema salifodinae]